jgi:hypothetical protein
MACRYGDESMKSWQSMKVQARRAIKDRGFVAHDANVLFRANCPNIDLVVFGKAAATYVKVKSSQKPAGSDAVMDMDRGSAPQWRPYLQQARWFQGGLDRNSRHDKDWRN